MTALDVLIVCTGNVCRSPAAEALLTGHLGSAASDWSIRSAGTRAVAGTPIDPTIADLLGRRGIETADFSARKLDATMLESADLILTATIGHRAAVARMLPAAIHRTLTLKQLARYAPFILESRAGIPPTADHLKWILDSVPHARGRATRDDDSIADPLGRSRRHYRTAVEEIDQACAAVASLLGAVGAGTPDSSRSWWSEMSAVETGGSSSL